MSRNTCSSQMPGPVRQLHPTVGRAAIEGAQEPVLLHRVDQLLENLFVHGMAGIEGVGIDLVDRDKLRYESFAVGSLVLFSRRRGFLRRWIDFLPMDSPFYGSGFVRQRGPQPRRTGQGG